MSAAAAPAGAPGSLRPDGPVLVGFSQDTLANDWRLAQVNDLRRSFGRLKGVELLITDGKGSTAQQIRDIEDLIDRKVDILLASPRDGTAMAPVLARAYRQGIPVVLLTRKVEGDAYTTFIAPDDNAIGRDAARHVATVLKGKGRILMLQGVPTASTAKARTSAFLAEIKKYPQLRVVATKVGNYLRSDAIRGVEEVIRDGIGFDAIYAQSDSMASGARMALIGAGRDPRTLPIVGIDYIGEARDAIRRGEQSASFTYPTCADEAAELVARLIAGKNVAKRVVVPSQKVTAANVEKIEPIF
jgi:ribose transport system substrate-binding protein